MSTTSTAFRRNVLTLLGGTALAQAVPLLAAPFLARMYSPEQFGALGLLLAIANPVSIVVCGRYELTVVLPREDQQANLLARLGLGLAVCTTLVLGLAIIGLRDPLSTILGGPGTLVPLLAAPVLFGLMGFFQPLNNWLIRKQAFRAMGSNKLVQTMGITLVSLVLGQWAADHGLILGYLAGWAAYVAIGVVQARRTGFRFRPVDVAAMREASRVHRDFPLYNTLPALLHTATLSIPIFFFMNRFGEEFTGQLNLCRQTVFLPVTFFATTWMQVYMQRASRTVIEKEPVLPGLRKSLMALVGMASVLAAVLIVAGPWLFGLVFGEVWVEAGRYARILAIPIALQFIVTPLTVLLPPLGRIKQLSLWQVVYFLSVLGYGCLPQSVATGYLKGLAVVESVVLLGLLFQVLRAAQRHDHDLRANDPAPAA